MTMTELKKVFKEATNRGSNYIAIQVQVGNSKNPETIINHTECANDKLSYYEKAYTDDLRLKNNNDIRIVNVAYGFNYSDIEREFRDSKKDNLEFKEVFEYLLKGACVKRKIWQGYWKLENDTIMIHCKNGRVLDIRETEDTIFTLYNILSSDWLVIDQ